MSRTPTPTRRSEASVSTEEIRGGTVQFTVGASRTLSHAHTTVRVVRPVVRSAQHQLSVRAIFASERAPTEAA